MSSSSSSLHVDDNSVHACFEFVSFDYTRAMRLFLDEVQRTFYSEVDDLDVPLTWRLQAQK